MNTNENTTTHPAQARELAREHARDLRKVLDHVQERGGEWTALPPERVLALATTLDALADECERLREALQKLSLHCDDLPAYYTRFHGQYANPQYVEQVKADVAEADALLAASTDAMQTDS